MTRARKLVALAALGMLGVWLAANTGRVLTDEEGIIRLVLGSLFAFLVLVRWKPDKEEEAAPAWLPQATVAAGAASVVTGLMVPFHQLEWLGLILVLYGCLRWALPPRFSCDLLLASFLLYWVHPLPAKIFDRLEMGMQWLSVQGAEWALHVLNVRVWADGLTLHTGFQVFGVPESCSGMMTAVTVMLCTLGVGVLLRAAWYEIAAFLALGLLQVLVLNVVRITGMVYYARRMPAEWATNFLHDTLGIFLLAGILLVQLEFSWWRVAKVGRIRRRDGVASGELEHRDKASPLPHFWVLVVRGAGWITLAAIVIAVVGFAGYKSRSAHRWTMRTGVVEGLIDSSLETAEKAVDQFLEQKPQDRGLRSSRARILVLRGKHSESLAAFDALPQPLETIETILKSWALMSLNRAEEAVALLDSLREQDKKLPGVAIVRAEYAAMQDDAKSAARYVVDASVLKGAESRVRALWPYLAARQQWLAISQSDNGAPFRDVLHGLLAVQANLEVKDPNRAATAMRRCLRLWPNDQRLLSPLFALASLSRAKEWEGHFNRNLRANLGSLNADTLSMCVGYGFRLQRPDLAWLAYLRLQKKSPRDPALSLLPAQYGHVWMAAERNLLGLGEDSDEGPLDLRPLYRLTHRIAPLRAFWEQIPLAQELAVRDVAGARRAYLRASLAEFARLNEAGELTQRMELQYTTALAMDGRYAEAHAQLNVIERKYPMLRLKTLLQHAELNERTERWEDAYESVMQFYAGGGTSDLGAQLLLVRTSLRLGLGVTALDAADTAARNFPDSIESTLARAAVWDAFGFKDQALFLLEQVRNKVSPAAILRLLQETGRFKEAERERDRLRVSEKMELGEQVQPTVPVAAEGSIRPRFPPALGPAEVARQAEVAEKRSAQAKSQFLRDLDRLTAAWYRGGGRGGAGEPERWAEAGRDAREKGSALHRLTMLQARQGDLEGALVSVGAALQHLPDCAILWRLDVALRKGDTNAVAEASAHCPDDPEIWLARLVTRVQAGKSKAVLEELGRMAAARSLPVETMVRAGDFLLRSGQPQAAAVAARDALTRARGYVPAYVLGVKCAVALKDNDWALWCALGGVENAVDPTPFYKAIVAIKAAKRAPDATMVAALEYLKERVQDEPLWTERLGQAYFEVGDTRRALAVLTPAMQSGIKDLDMQSLLIAAEAARIDGQIDRSTSILETAQTLYPNRTSILNNLVYNLIQDPATLPRAREILPVLLQRGSNSFAVLDTAAMFHLRAGEAQKAKELEQKALALLNEKDYAAAEVKLNAARVEFELGELDAAEERVQKLLREHHLRPLVETRARELARAIEKEQRERRRLKK